MDEIDKRYSLQSLIPWMKSGSIKKENMRCLNQDTPVTSMCGKSHKMQFIGLTLVALSEWNSNSTRPGRTRTFSMRHSTSVCIERVVSRKNQEILFSRISKSPRPAHTITLKSNWRTDLGDNAEEPVSGSQLASTEKLVTLKSRTVLDQQKEREVKNEDEEYDQASTEKPVTLKKRTLLDRQKEQEVKYEDEGNDQAITWQTQYHKQWNFRFLTSGFVALRSWTSRRREISSTGGQNWGPSSKKMSTTLAANIRRRWFTNWASSTSNYTKRIPKCNAPIVYLVDPSNVLLYLWALFLTTQKKCVNWTRDGFMCHQFRTW